MSAGIVCVMSPSVKWIIWIILGGSAPSFILHPGINRMKKKLKEEESSK